MIGEHPRKLFWVLVYQDRTLVGFSAVESCCGVHAGGEVVQSHFEQSVWASLIAQPVEVPDRCGFKIKDEEHDVLLTGDRAVAAVSNMRMYLQRYRH